MLEWKVVTGEEKFQRLKEGMKHRFDEWFSSVWAHKYSREEMLSPQSPLPHVYALMCLPSEEARKIHPSDYYEECSDCGKRTDIWLETDFSFCDEYGCGMSLCPDCARKLKAEIELLERRVDG